MGGNQDRRTVTFYPSTTGVGQTTEGRYVEFQRLNTNDLFTSKVWKSSRDRRLHGHVQNFGNGLLLRARQPLNLFDLHLQFRLRSRLRPFRSRPQQIIGGHVQNCCQLQNLIRSQGNWSPFPPGICRLRNAHSFGKLLLRQSGRLPQSMQSFTEGWTWSFSWSARIHAAII